MFLVTINVIDGADFPGHHVVVPLVVVVVVPLGGVEQVMVAVPSERRTSVLALGGRPLAGPFGCVQAVKVTLHADYVFAFRIFHSLPRLPSPTMMNMPPVLCLFINCFSSDVCKAGLQKI